MALPISVTANCLFSKIASLSIVEDQNLFLNYWEQGGSVVNLPLAACCPKVVASMSLEVSVDENFIFVAGCDKMDVTEGRPIITALTFDSSLRQKALIHLSDVNMRNIFKLKRILSTKEDILLASGFNAISIVYFNPQMCIFQELKTLGGLHEGEIFDFCIYNDIIYSISGKDTYIHKY